MRMCLGCRQMKPKKELLRIVVNKEGIVSVDLTGKSAGRGAYICNDPACTKKLIKGRMIDKNFGCKVPDEVYEQIEKELING